MKHPVEVETMLCRLSAYMRAKQISVLTLRVAGGPGLSVRQVPYERGVDAAVSKVVPAGTGGTGPPQATRRG